MKLKALALALFIAGACTSFALADNGPGKGKKPSPSAGTTAGSTTTGATTTTGSTTPSETGGKGKSDQVKADKKVTICHKAGKSGRWVKISVAKNAVKSGLKHGDVLPDASGKCPASTTPTTTTQDATTDATTTTTATTTTAATTTTNATTTTSATTTTVAMTTTTP